MRRLRFGWVAFALLALVISGTEIHSALKRDTPAARKLEREIRQRRVAERKRQETNINWVRSRALGGDESHPADFDRTIIRESAPAQSGYSASAMVPPPSPGIVIGRSSYDYQHNSSQGYQVGRTSGANVVHFVWMGWHQILSEDDDDRTVYYNSYKVSTNFLQNGTGTVVALGYQARAGYVGLDVDIGNCANVSLHQREDATLPYSPWHLYFPPPDGLHIDDRLGGYAAGGCPEVLWPRNAASRDAGNSGVWHLIAHSNTNECATDLLWYWRYDGAIWAGPVVIDSTPQISYVIADDPNSNKLAVAVHVSNHSSMMGINNVAYLQSLTDGVGWINNTEAKTKTVITNYNNEDGPGAWLHISITYDNSSVLHLIYDEQQDANDNSLTAIRHWNSSRNIIRPVALNYAPTPLLTGVFDLNLAKVTMGIGDGATVCGGQTNNNYVYATYTKFGGSTAAEQADASFEGRYNGELYLSVSNSGGNTWAPPVNLSNTKTPNCNPGYADGPNGEPQRPDSVCRSEHWATIGRIVGDIDIFFISDLDAGGVIQSEGTWQMNPVHYYRIPGGTPNSIHVCPSIAASIEVVLTETEECEYHAPQAGSNDETMSIINLGNATLTGNVSVMDFPGAPTLTLSGGDGPFSISAGSPDIVKTVTMSSNGAPEGMYQGEITITHNDLTPPDPRVFPIDFFVFNEFFCPEDEVLKTGVATPGSLALEIESNGRFGSQNAEGGLWRHTDSSSSIFDASLLIAHGSQAPDTTVFRRFYDNPANGQFGFRALGDMIVDTATYGSGDGCATAVARMCTRDSVVGIQVEWVFPQHPDDDELVVCRYKLYRHDAGTAISDLAIGILIDADAIPAARLGSIQNGVSNTSGVDGTRNLVWVGGVDTADHIPTATNTSTRFRGGLAVPDGFAGATFGDGPSDLQVGGGPKDEFLYGKLQSLTGTEPFPGNADLYMLVALDRGQSIAVGETLTYVLVYASDTISEASFKATVDRGIDLATYPNLCRSGCNCICAGDPFCDGVVANIQDVVVTLNVAFRGVVPEIDPECPFDRTDVNCNGSSEVIDVVKVVNVALRGANAATEFCAPCQ